MDLFSPSIPRISQEIVLAPSPIHTEADGTRCQVPVVHNVDSMMRNSNEQRELRAVRWALWWVTSHPTLHPLMRAELDALWQRRIGTHSPRVIASATRAYVPLTDVVGVLRRFVIVAPDEAAPENQCCPLWKLLCVERTKHPILFHGQPPKEAARVKAEGEAVPVKVESDGAACDPFASIAAAADTSKSSAVAAEAAADYEDSPLALWVLMRAGVSGRRRPFGFVLNDTKKKRERLLKCVEKKRQLPRFRLLDAPPAVAPLVLAQTAQPMGRVMSVDAHAAHAEHAFNHGPSARTRGRRAAATRATRVSLGLDLSDTSSQWDSSSDGSVYHSSSGSSYCGSSCGSSVDAPRRKRKWREHEIHVRMERSPPPVSKRAHLMPPAMAVKAELRSGVFEHALPALVKSEKGAAVDFMFGYPLAPAVKAEPLYELSPVATPTTADGDKVVLDGCSNDSFGSDWYTKMLQSPRYDAAPFVASVPTPPGSPALWSSLPPTPPRGGVKMEPLDDVSRWFKAEPELT